MKVKVNGIYMNYEVKGKGTNLVLVHGAGDNLNMWYNQVPVFSKNYRVITYDVRGSGKTERPEGEYPMSLLAEDAYQLMKAIAVEEAYFLGYSMGGHISFELALNHPELVKALILANSPVRLTPPTPETLERFRVFRELIDKGDMSKVVEKMTADAFSPNFKSKHPAEFKKYMKVKLQNKPDSMGRTTRSLTEHYTPADLKKLKCSVLLIGGEYDPIGGVAQVEESHKAIAGSKLVILPTGHAAAIESPEKFNSAVLEFLSGVKSG